MANCKDCLGSGEYVGFSSVENCRTCAGSGKVRSDPTDPVVHLQTLLRELDEWRDRGSITFVEEVLNKIFRHVACHSDLVPAGVSSDDVLDDLQREIYATWDIAGAPLHNRAALLQKRKGQYGGLVVPGP